MSYVVYKLLSYSWRACTHKHAFHCPNQEKEFIIFKLFNRNKTTAYWIEKPLLTMACTVPRWWKAVDETRLHTKAPNSVNIFETMPSCHNNQVTIKLHRWKPNVESNPQLRKCCLIDWKPPRTVFRWSPSPRWSQFSNEKKDRQFNKQKECMGALLPKSKQIISQGMKNLVGNHGRIRPRQAWNRNAIYPYWREHFLSWMKNPLLQTS